jgi:hypothetical protein
MKNKKAKYLIILIFVFTVLLMLSFKEEHDPLHKRTFNISLSETKNGVVAKKVLSDELYFKNGKLFSNLLFDKFGYKYIRYRINKDSIFTDSTDSEVRMLVVEASMTDETNQTVLIDFVTSEWDIDGTIKITKNDKIKRYYDFAGREKGGKPKKAKRNKSQETPSKL